MWFAIGWVLVFPISAILYGLYQAVREHEDQEHDRSMYERACHHAYPLSECPHGCATSASRSDRD